MGKFTNILRKISIDRKIKRLLYVLAVVAITVVIFANIFMSLSLYQHGWKPNTIDCVGLTALIKEKRVLNTSKIINHEHDKTIYTHVERKTQKHSSDFPIMSTIKNVKKDEKKMATRNPRIKIDLGNEKAKDKCPINKILQKEKSSLSNEEVLCQPHEPTQEACAFAAKLYPFNSSLIQCKDKVKAEFCSIDSTSKTIEIKCYFPSSCKRILVHGVDENTGVLQVKGTYLDLQSLERGINKIIEEATLHGFQFVFIECFEKSQFQLLSWNDRSRSSRHKTQNGHHINVNIVLLDSISRAHFYRSLPLVIEEFERQNRNSSSGEILDFSLFQSVHGHSAENAHALFAGQLFPETMTEAEKERMPVGHGVLFKRFKTIGYRTMYQDDLCWKYVWGLRKELGSPRTWEIFLEEINKAYIDDTGLTLASCKILQSNNLRNPFSESKNNQICFNNKFQHDYILDYSTLFHENSSSPTISYSTLNTAHDWHGIRTQTFNQGLVSYVKRVSTLKNTITLMLADHGNTYTPYVRKILEGRFEMYHPSFFMVVPQSAAKALGNDVMDALRANQNRLLTMLDIHAGLAAIAHLSQHGSMPRNGGIFTPIPAERKCSDLEMRLPNLCLCDGWDSEAANDSMQVSVVEYGVGMLNNRIEEQRRKYHEKISGNGSTEIGPRKCNHLVPLYFRNVRERNNGDSLVTVFDFVVASGKGSVQNEELFHVETESVIKPGVIKSYIKLLSFDRLSQYGPYSACADDGVDLRLCVCSLAVRDKENEEEMSVNTLWRLMPKLPDIQSKSMLYSRKNEPCIYIISRNYYVKEDEKIDKTRLQTSTLEVVNLCSNRSFAIEVRIKPKFMKISSSALLQVTVTENTLKFLCVLVTENITWPTSYTFTYSVEGL